MTGDYLQSKCHLHVKPCISFNITTTAFNRRCSKMSPGDNHQKILEGEGTEVSATGVSRSAVTEVSATGVSRSAVTEVSATGVSRSVRVLKNFQFPPDEVQQCRSHLYLLNSWNGSVNSSGKESRTVKNPVVGDSAVNKYESLQVLIKLFLDESLQVLIKLFLDESLQVLIKLFLDESLQVLIKLFLDESLQVLIKLFLDESLQVLIKLFLDESLQVLIKLFNQK
ncbi:hypothetical protein Btru_069251 [Bulinus truncatus]|nr:hypothetical protein Btru_069251 [Bulinus truncatus]